MANLSALPLVAVRSDADGISFIDKEQERIKYRGVGGLTVSGGRMFNRPPERQTNGALVDRRYFRAADDRPREITTIAQTSFIRNGSALLVTGRISSPTHYLLSFNDCDRSNWNGAECRGVSEDAMEVARAMLSSALSTVPEF